MNTSEITNKIENSENQDYSYFINLIGKQLCSVNYEIVSISRMFYNCVSLTSLPDLSEWNTNNVTDFSGMFHNCASLSSLSDISQWKTNNATNFSYFFLNVHLYQIFLIFQNGILIMLKI